MGRRSRKRSVSGAGREPGSRTAADEAPAGPPTRAERDAERRRRRAGEAPTGPGDGRGRRDRRATGERPRPPWGSFPLTELAVLLAILSGVAGLVSSSPRGQVMLVAGFALGSLAGLELSIREHFAGYRSHTTLLAGCAAFAAGAVMVLAVTGLTAPAPAVLVALAVFAVAFYLLREAFKRRSGGLGFR